MFSTADVVVIGAGVQGLSSAYHLAKKGIKRILVLEKEFIGAGSSSRTGSMLMLQRENDPKIKLSQYSFDRYMAFESELGVNPGYKRIGFLSVATEKMALEALKMAKTRQEMGVQTDILGPIDIQKLVPVVNTSDIVVGIFGPDDGMIDPTAIMNGYKEGAKRNGAEICLGKEFEVIGIELRRDQVCGVRTRSGFVSTRNVVNATGADAIEVASWVGLSLPIMNRRRNIFITEPFPDIQDETPLVEDAEKEWYYRKEGPSVLMGMGKEESINVSMTPNFDFLPEIVDFAIHRVPIFAKARFDHRKGWSGIRSLTPDLCPIIGPVNGIRGYFNCCGWGGEGIMHAPAGGQLIAECIHDGEATTQDITPFLASRFIDNK
jgi:sarcosine oxidase subunit beta